TITGAGSANTIIDSSEISTPVLYIGPNITATISGVTIQGGREFNGCGCGGGIYVDSHGTLNLTASRVISNTDLHAGGGIYDAAGFVTLRRVTLSHNTAEAAAGYYASGLVDDIVDSTISDNTATGTDGGGIFGESSALDIVNSTISENFAYR